MLSSDGARRNFNSASDIVELLIYTNDPAFMQTLREAVGDSRRLWHVPSADKVSDLLLAGQVGILVLDVQSQSDAAGSLVAQIKRQFPDLVMVVAGNREAETSLARLISDGTVYRFIHKPMSPGRAKLFADAAVKKYEEQRRQVRMPAVALRPAPLDRRKLLIAGTAGVGAVAVVAALIVALARHDSSEEALPAAASPTPAVGVSAPPSASPAEIRERLLARAENALLEDRLADAASAIDAARNAGVEGGRIAFLTAQLAKMREQSKELANRAHAKSDARPAEADSSDDRLQRLLGLAAERIKQDRLIDPDKDSATFYVEAAMRLDPSGNATEAAKETLAKSMLAQTHQAIEHRDFERADILLDAAAGVASPANLDIARQQLAAARRQSAVDASDQLLKSAQERMQQDRLIEPANDSAKYYLMTLRDLSPGNTGLAPALDDLGQRLVAKARHAVDLKQYENARGWLQEAAAVGFTSADAGAVQRELDAASQRQQFLTEVTDASKLTLVKSVKPDYPVKARQDKIEGWVELDFTVGETGQVREIAVHAASPQGVFDSTAITALSHWRYQPVLKDAKPSAQRARIRIRFTLSG